MSDKPVRSVLLWCDLETTGTDETLDAIIEVACILTTPELEPIDEYQSIIVPGPGPLARLVDNDFVRQMHTDNGLLGEILIANQTPDTRFEHYTPKVQDDLIDWLDRNLLAQCLPEAKPMLAGSGVGHFDRRFIKSKMPMLEARLVYPVLDVGVVRRFLQGVCHLETWVPPLNESKTHRALDDIRIHLNEARAYRDLFQRLNSLGGWP